MPEIGASDVIALIALFVSAFAWQHNHSDRVQSLTNRLFDIDALVIEHPKLMLILAEYAAKAPKLIDKKDTLTLRYDYKKVDHYDAFFNSPCISEEDKFRIKALIYSHFNFYDETVSIMESGPIGVRHLQQRSFEYREWKEYIMQNLSHPIYLAVYDVEKSKWGQKFRAFIDSKRNEIENTPCSLKHFYQY